jgi:hypothetical protein
MVTACTDNTVRFWRCNLFTDTKANGSVQEYLRWEEWQMISKEGKSLLSIPGAMTVFTIQRNRFIHSGIYVQGNRFL